MRSFLFVALLATLATMALAGPQQVDESNHVRKTMKFLTLSAPYKHLKFRWYYAGKGTTFYSWLDVPPTAALADINKAYRKKSMQLHPDKNPGVKGIQERFARLGVIVNILRSPEGRKRYDFFYKNGVPKWRGTGYYYSRFRPGLVTVLSFLVILTSGLQYLVQTVNYRRDLEKVRQTVSDARMAAWGPKMVPTEGRRKVKVNLGGGPRIDEDGNVVPGKVIEMIVDGNGVYLCDGPEAHVLDETSATPPAISRTWFVSLVRGLMRRTQESEAPLGTMVVDEEPKRPAPASMAGGQRRRAVRRR